MTHMKFMRLILLATVAAAPSFSFAEEIDYTKRTVTDPLLKISSSTTLLPEKDDKGLGAARDEKHVPPVYRRIWSHQDVIMLEPFSREKPAHIDFSAITKNGKGVLRIEARNHPGGDFVLELFKAGQSFKKETIGSNKWERFTVPFDHEEITLKNIANGWNCEFAFIDYSIGKAP
jgi:hypothetical protein